MKLQLILLFRILWRHNYENRTWNFSNRGLILLTKNYRKFSENLAKLSVFKKFLQISKLCSYKKCLAIFSGICPASCTKKILPEVFLVSQKKIVGSKFSVFSEKCFSFPEKYSDLRIYVYKIKPLSLLLFESIIARIRFLWRKRWRGGLFRGPV